MKKYIILPIPLLIAIFFLKMFFSNQFSSRTSGISGFFSEKDTCHLFIGSSQTRQSLDPKILNDSLGSSYIIAYNGNSFFYMNLITESIIRKNIKVKKLIIESYPYRAYQKTELVDTRLFFDFDFSNKFRLLSISWPFLSGWKIYELIMLSGNENIFAFPFIRRTINSLSYKGGYIGKIVDGVSKEQFNNFTTPYDNGTSYNGLDSLQVMALKNIIKVCNMNNIPLIFLEPSVPKHIYESKFFRMAHHDLKQIVISNGGKYIDQIDYNFDNTNPTYFHDPLHLSTEGRYIYTKKIIPFVR